MKHIWYNYKENIMKTVFFLNAMVAICSLLLICVFLVSSSIPALQKIGVISFLSGQSWKPENIPPEIGILPMLLGSIYVAVGAIIVGVPIGILTAIFLTFYCPKKLHYVLQPATQLLAGIPSVVYGFFGLVVLVPLISLLNDEGNGKSILTASILLGIMILPTIIGISEAALRAVPTSYYEGAVALGASKEKAIFSVVLPATSSGIISSVILGIGRAIGEAMAVVMVAGNQARIPISLWKGVRTMTTNIVLEMGYASGLHRESLFATALVLFMLILIINILFAVLKKTKEVK